MTVYCICMRHYWNHCGITSVQMRSLLAGHPFNTWPNFKSNIKTNLTTTVTMTNLHNFRGLLALCSQRRRSLFGYHSRSESCASNSPLPQRASEQACGSKHRSKVTIWYSLCSTILCVDLLQHFHNFSNIVWIGSGIKLHTDSIPSADIMWHACWINLYI